jgi:hypothetical protein
MMDSERRRQDYVTKVDFSDAIEGIHTRLDKQDGKLDTLDQINTHMRVMCNLAKWGWKVIGVLAVVLPAGRAMGWW